MSGLPNSGLKQKYSLYNLYIVTISVNMQKQGVGGQTEAPTPIPT